MEFGLSCAEAVPPMKSTRDCTFRGGVASPMGSKVRDVSLNSPVDSTYALQVF